MWVFAHSFSGLFNIYLISVIHFSENYNSTLHDNKPIKRKRKNEDMKSGISIKRVKHLNSNRSEINDGLECRMKSNTVLSNEKCETDYIKQAVPKDKMRRKEKIGTEKVNKNLNISTKMIELNDKSHSEDTVEHGNSNTENTKLKHVVVAIENTINESENAIPKSRDDIQQKCRASNINIKKSELENLLGNTKSKLSTKATNKYSARNKSYANKLVCVDGGKQDENSSHNSKKMKESNMKKKMKEKNYSSSLAKPSDTVEHGKPSDIEEVSTNAKSLKSDTDYCFGKEVKIDDSVSNYIINYASISKKCSAETITDEMNQDFDNILLKNECTAKNDENEEQILILEEATFAEVLKDCVFSSDLNPAAKKSKSGKKPFCPPVRIMTKQTDVPDTIKQDAFEELINSGYDKHDENSSFLIEPLKEVDVVNTDHLNNYGEEFPQSAEKEFNSLFQASTNLSEKTEEKDVSNMKVIFELISN